MSWKYAKTHMTSFELFRLLKLKNISLYIYILFSPKIDWVWQVTSFREKNQIVCIKLLYNNWYQNKIVQVKLQKRKNGRDLKSNLHKL